MSCGTPTVKSIGIHAHNQLPSSHTILREERLWFDQRLILLLLLLQAVGGFRQFKTPAIKGYK